MKIKLTDLEPAFYRYERRIETYSIIEGDPLTWHERGEPTKKITGPRDYKVPVQTLAEAQCLCFLCPLCFEANGGRVGTHHCLITIADRAVPDDMGTHNKAEQPTRWNLSGTDFSNLTATPSILLEGGCNWHGFITNGEVT